MIFFLRMFKSEILNFLLIGLLFVLISVLSFKLFFQEKKILILERTSKGTKVLDKSSVTSLEVKVFLRRFLVLSLNYHEKSFLKHMERAGNLMSLRFWNEKKKELLELQREVSLKKIEQQAEILEIKAVSEKNFEALVSITLFEKQKKTFHKKIKVFLTLKEAKRTKSNVWGVEVEALKFKL